jgi:signal transduction histidine kinase
MINEMRNKLAYTCALVSGVGCLLLFAVRTLVGGAHYLQNIHMPLISLITVFMAYSMKKYNSRKLFDVFFLVYIHTWYLYTCLKTGGFSSSQIQWYYAFSFAITIFYGIRRAGYYYVYHGFVLVLASIYILKIETVLNPDSIQYFVVSTSLLVLGAYLDQVYKALIIKEGQLQQAQAITEFRRGILHEINNPLTVIRVIADRYAKTDPNEINEKLQRNSQRIQEVMSRIHNTGNETIIGIPTPDEESECPKDT